MKTPREILLERHQAAAPKLDSIRNEIVTELNHKDTKTQSPAFGLVSLCLGGSKKLWFELVWPSRRIWASLAVVWVLLFIFNFSQRDKTELMAKKLPPSPQIILAFRQQEKLLNELLGQNESPVVESPKTFSPKPSSERCFETLMT